MTHIDPTQKPRRLRATAALGCLVLIAAIAAGCGGGSGGDADEPAAPPAAALPQSLTVTGPAAAETGATVRWQSSLGTVPSGWTVRWDFGDGSSSDEAQPTHTYNRGGDYDVRLTVGNGGPDSRVAQASVRVRASDLTQDRVCSGPAQAGWCWQQPLPFARDLTDAVFADTQTLYAVGPGTTIVSTRNGGADWSAQSAPAAPPQPANSYRDDAKKLHTVRFADAQVGVAVASFPGRLLRTQDGGATWAVPAELPMWWVKRVWMLDRQTIVVTGFRQYDRFGYGLNFADLSLISSDGGQTWREAALVVTTVTADRALWRMSWAGYWVSGKTLVSRDLGLTAVETDPCCAIADRQPARPERQDDTDQLMLTVSQADASVLLPPQGLARSTDAGRTWNTVTVVPPAGGVDQRLVGVGYRSVSEAWATFDRSSLEGHDRIHQWQRAMSSDGGHIWAAVGPPIEAPFTTGRLWRLDTVGWLLASPNSPDAVWFDDGDAAVHALRLPEDGALLLSIARRDGTLLAGYGSLGTADRWYTSTDAGARWTLVPGGQPGVQLEIEHLWFFDTRQGLAADSSGGFLRTDDGGRSWTPQSSTPQQAWSSLLFTADATGWGLANGVVWRSTDHGLSWLPLAVPAGQQPQQLHALDSNHAWLKSWVCIDPTDYSSCSIALIRTTDGGATWEPLATPGGVQRLYFSSIQNGVAVAYGSVWVTIDGGQTWLAGQVPTLAPPLVQIQFVDAQHGWMLYSGVVGPRGGIGSSVLRTTDGGRTWTEATALPAGANALHGVAFADASTGWVVGDGGRVLATHDGGDTWEAQASGTGRALTSVAAVDAFTAWVGGERGAILVTATGGQ